MTRSVDWTIAEDIRDAETLPAWVYADADMHALQKDKVFARSWQWIGDLDHVRTPQHAWPVTLMEGMLDEPIVVTRDERDQLHCMSNVCTHRGNLVVHEACRTAHLRCAYHGRKFGLDGKFQHMPEFEEARGFPSAKDDLCEAPFGTWKRFAFAGVKPTWKLERWLSAVEQRVGWMPVEQFVFDPSRSRDYLVRANWALYVDNYLEGFHIPFVHSGLNAALDYGQYRTELFECGNLQLGVAKGGENVFELPRGSQDFGQHIAAYYFWLFPNFMLNFYPWGLSINVVRPVGPALTKVSFITYVWDESRMDQGAGAGLDRVEREDETVVEGVQRGVRSRWYERGRYSPTREMGVHQFHSLLTQAMRG